MTCLRPFAFGLCLAVAVSGELRAQEPKPAPSPVAEGAAAAQAARERDRALIVPLKIRVVLSKYQGDKKISSLPYELTVRTDGSKALIRTGAQVAVPSATALMEPPSPPAKPGEPADRRPPLPGRSFSYRDVGTNIDCQATNLDAGRYAVTVTIEDTSVYPGERDPNARAQPGDMLPAFRTFRTTNALVLRDGQTTEFSLATDKMTGEVMKAEVSVTVIK